MIRCRNVCRGFSSTSLIWLALVIAVVVGVAVLLVRSYNNAASRSQAQAPVQGYVEGLVAAKGSAEAVVCKSQLQALGSILRAYAVEHGGNFPPALDSLKETGLVGAEMFRCPIRPHRPFVYIPGQKDSSPPANVLVYEDAGAHDGMANFVRVDGSPDALPADQVQAAAGRTRAELGAGAAAASAPAATSLPVQKIRI